MQHSAIAILALTALPLLAQGQAILETPLLNGPELEATHQANPDDTIASARLLRYYAGESRDPVWTRRFEIVCFNVQRHPDAVFLGYPDIYSDIPAAMIDQVRRLWIIQVHQNPDKAQVLRNAAAAFDQPGNQLRVPGNVQAAKLVYQVQPPYPPLARAARVQGTVRFNATIGREGAVSKLQLVSGHPLFIAAAQQAVEQWLYKPTLLNGEPAQVVTNIEVTFALADVPEQLNRPNWVLIQ